MMFSTDIAAGPETGDNRIHERSRLVHYLRVFDADTGVLLGHAADISRGGIKLVSFDKIEMKRNYLLKVVLPKEVSGRSELIISAESSWSESDANADFTITGFKFRSLDDEQAAHVDAVNEEFRRDMILSPVTAERPACSIDRTAGR